MWSLKTDRHLRSEIKTQLFYWQGLTESWELSWKHLLGFPGLLWVVMLPSDALWWRGSDDSRCELVRRVSDVNNWEPQAELSQAQCQPRLTVNSSSPTKKALGPGRWTLLDAAHYIFLSRSERSTLRSSRQRNQRIRWNWTTTFSSKIQLAGVVAEIFWFSLKCFFQLFSIICAVLNGLWQIMMFSPAIIVI